MPKFKVRFLIHRTKTNQSGERRDYYFWSPPKKVQERYGLAPVRLARELSEVAAPNILLETAIAEAALLNAEYDRKRATPVAVDPATVVGTLPWVIAEFKKSPKWFRLSNATRSRTYEYGFGVLKKWSAEKNHPHIKHITRRHCYRLYLALCNIDPITEEMQLASAKNVMSTLRRLLGFAQQLIDGFTVNPATKLEVVTPESRKQIWEDEELQRLLETARAAGRPSIGLAAVLGSELAQRRGDTLKLTWEQYEAPTKGMRRGSFLIRQKKTNAIVRVPVTKRLFEVLRKINRREGPIVRNEKTGEAYVEDTFAHKFREIANQADLHFHLFLDLRRTGVVNLGRAGCTIPEISAISGHDIEDTKRILETYLPRDSIMAAHAMEKLEDYRAGGAEQADRGLLEGLDSPEVETAVETKVETAGSEPENP